MNYPITLSCDVVLLSETDQGVAWVSVGESLPSPIRVKVELRLQPLDDPATLQDIARQVMAQVCEAL